MSMLQEAQICCPQCGQAAPFQLWETIQASQDPTARQRILDGTFFQFICPRCGASMPVHYTCLYHDPQRRQMVYLLAEEQVELARAIAQCRTALRQEYQQQLAQYRTRFVTSGHSLREKLLIWDRGRDDRLVELCKLFLQTNLPKHRPDFQLEEAYYDWQDDVECLRLFSKEGQAALYPLDPLYQQLSPAFTPHLPPEDPAGFPLVDLAWAARQLESMTENDPR